ncbi:tetratricopeptide repeat protein [bacterium]|nr:tetratricopeptide repeat protein [bacterium]
MSEHRMAGEIAGRSQAGKLRRAAVSLALLAFAAVSPLQAQTALTMANPEALSKSLNSKTEIERCIILATPDSLARAKDGLAQSKVISEDDRRALSEIVRGISSLLYPRGPNGAAKAAKAGGNGNDAAPRFFVDPSLTAISPAYAVCLTQLVEASQGRIFDAPKGSDDTFLTAILPALAIFTTSEKNVADAALAYAERFAKSGTYPTAIVGLVRARGAEKAGDLVKAYYDYQAVADAYPDVWIAKLRLGIVALALDMPVRALGFLEPLAEAGTSDLAVLAPYATALYRNGRLAEAEPVVMKCLAADPEAPPFLSMAAHILIDRNDFAAAQPLLETLGRKIPNDKFYLSLRALQAKGQGRADEAIKYARKALQASPDDPEAMVLLAGILFGDGAVDHAEATSLCLDAQKRFAAEKAAQKPAGAPLPSPLAKAMRDEAERQVSRYLLLDAYDRQDWFAAAKMLDAAPTAGLNKSVVATILRRSGREKEAVAFASEGYRGAPDSEDAAEAYLRSLAAASVASAGQPAVSDIGAGLLGQLNAAKAGSPSVAGQPALVGIVLQLLSGSCSDSLRSYLHYLNGTLLADDNAAIDSFRMALLERADNVEAIVALAKAYARKGDAQKALFFVRQAKAIGVADAELASELKTLELKLAQG